MSNSWIKLGCFLTGYKYSRLKYCSIASEKTVKKYTSAILLICMLWGFIGYGFTNLYIISPEAESAAPRIIINLLGSAIMIVAVLQIERQIILSDRTNWRARSIRIVIGFIMAIIGSIIIDQMLLHKDIQAADEPSIRVDADAKTKVDIDNMNKRIDEIRNSIAQWNEEIKNMDGQVYQENTSSTSNKSVGKVNGKDSVLTTSLTNSHSKTPIQNPNIDRITQYNSNIQNNIAKIDSILQGENSVHENAMEYVRKNRGFLKEMDALYLVLFKSNSWSALIVWMMFWLLLFLIEMFVLAIKFFDKNNDYDEAVQHQMEIYIEQLKALEYDTSKNI